MHKLNIPGSDSHLKLPIKGRINILSNILGSAGILYKLHHKTFRRKVYLSKGSEVRLRRATPHFFIDVTELTRLLRNFQQERGKRGFLIDGEAHCLDHLGQKWL